MNIRYIWYKICSKMQGVAVSNSKISKDAKIEAGTVFLGSKIDRFSYCGYGCFIVNARIGAFCSLSDNVSIGGGTHPINWVSSSPAFYKGRDSISKRLAKKVYNMNDPETIIGNDVWIGRGVYIKSGVRIGDGAIVGMGAVVTKDVEPYSIMAGNPAREIKKRFSEKVCEELLRTRWWDRSEEEIDRLSNYIDDVDTFLQMCRK